MLKSELLNLINTNLSIIPIASKKKSPHHVLGKTHMLLNRRATAAEVEDWVNAKVTSFAVAGGSVSGNLVTLDFDEKHLFGLYDSWYNKLSDDQKIWVDKCQKNSTRNKGTHLRYRTETSQPTVKLARRVEYNKESEKEEIVTIAETRGENAYALIPPTDGYINLQGSLDSLPLLPDEIHEELIDILRTFNEVYDEPEPVHEWKTLNSYSSERPGDRMNNNATWEEILEPHGWKKDGANYWIRPGKDTKDGISATTDYEGIPMFYVFSTSAAPFKENTGYSKFHVYTLLNHSGNFSEAAKAAAEKYPQEQDNIDTSKFEEIKIEDVCRILDSTIKKDDANKSITFLSMLTTYTEDAQMNLFFNAPSSTGKSHIPLSVVDLFPKKDQIILGHCSPAAFFHEQGVFNKEKNEIRVDLSRKILIFTDMPNPILLERIRSVLSHDLKEFKFKITDKDQKGGNRTKNGVIVGYPSVYFCSAGLRVDEQESTRFLMLSPSVEQDKIIQGIKQSISKESNRENFINQIENDSERNLLKERILAIKYENIDDVVIKDNSLVEKLFFKDSESFQPRQQRDIKKIMSLIKGFTLLNLWYRDRDGSQVYANEEDIRNGFKLWEQISYGQEYGIPPYLMKIYTKVILPLWEKSGEHNLGIKKAVTRMQILECHHKNYGRSLGGHYLRTQILPQLEASGLITQERSQEDGRQMVVIPLETDFPVELPEVKVNM